MQKYDPPKNPLQNPQIGRGRPRAFDRQTALDQATRLFWMKGFDATSISDLKAAMGIGAPSLYAAFTSKEALYAEALRHYADDNDHLAWSGFGAAQTLREAVESFLMDSAAALTGTLKDIPLGCMVTLSSVSGDEHPELGELVRTARTAIFKRLRDRIAKGLEVGELPASTNVDELARFVQVVQSGMSILARDGVHKGELEAVAEVAMAGWDAKVALVNKSRSM